MFEELEQLRADAHLFGLLSHYAELGVPDREAWQDRLMALAGVEGKELSRLHGELIAYGWVEQNTGATPVLKPGVVAACYRITTAGQRALKRPRTERSAEEDAEAA
jgi:hypothetical protein